jgi:hypothetical protein
MESKSVKNTTTNSFAGYQYLPIIKLIWITQANRLYVQKSPDALCFSPCVFTPAHHPASCWCMNHQTAPLFWFVLTLSQSNEIEDPTQRPHHNSIPGCVKESSPFKLCTGYLPITVVASCVISHCLFTVDLTLISNI